MEKFTPLAKILHWRHWQIPPLGIGRRLCTRPCLNLKLARCSRMPRAITTSPKLLANSFSSGGAYKQGVTRLLWLWLLDLQVKAEGQEMGLSLYQAVTPELFPRYHHSERFLIWQNVSNFQVATRFLWQQVKIVWVLFNGHGDDERCACNCNNLNAVWSWVIHVIHMALRGFPVWYQALERSSRRGNLYRALRCGTEGILAGSDLVICVTLSWATPVLCNCWPSLLQGGMISIICWVGGISILMHGLCFLSCQWLFLHRWWQEARF